MPSVKWWRRTSASTHAVEDLCRFCHRSARNHGGCSIAKIDAKATAANAEVNPNLSMEDATTQETIALSVDTDAVSFDAIAETRITAASQADVLSNLTAKIIPI